MGKSSFSLRSWRSLAKRVKQSTRHVYSCVSAITGLAIITILLTIILIIKYHILI